MARNLIAEFNASKPAPPKSRELSLADKALMAAYTGMRSLQKNLAFGFYDDISQAGLSDENKRKMGLIDQAAKTAIPTISGAQDFVSSMMNPMGKAKSIPGMAGEGFLFGTALSTGKTEAEKPEDRLAEGVLDGAVSAVASPLLGKGLPAAVDAVAHPKDATQRLLRPITGSLSDDAATSAAYRNLAKKLVSEGYSPEKVAGAISRSRQAGQGATLAESTGSRGLLTRQQKLATGSGQEASHLQKLNRVRRDTIIPRKINQLGNQFSKEGQKGVERIGEILETQGKKQIDISNIIDDVSKGATGKAPDSVEGKAYARASDVLERLRTSGGQIRSAEGVPIERYADPSAKAIHFAKQELDAIVDDLVPDATAEAARRRTYGVVSRIRKQLNEQLAKNLDGYADANRLVQKKIAGERIGEAVANTQDGSTATLRNRIFNRPAFREEYRDLLDPEDFDKLRSAMNETGRIQKGRFGGSDTQPLQEVAAEMADETGSKVVGAAGRPLNALGKAADAINSHLRGRDNEAAARILMKPDAPRLSAQMGRAQATQNNPAAQALAKAGAAAPATSPAESPPEPKKRNLLQEMNAAQGTEVKITPMRAELQTESYPDLPAGISPGMEEDVTRGFDTARPESVDEQFRAPVFDKAMELVFEFEGGYVPDDAGKGPSKFGVNKTANPDLDIENLTEDRAKKRYRNKYWNAINADELSPEMALVGFDAAVNHGPGKARYLIKQAKGDPQKLLILREKEYARLVKADPKKYAKYAEGWLGRLKRLQEEISQEGTT